MDHQNQNALLRVLDLKDAVAVGLGAIIGAGIFVVTGVAAGISGPAFLISLIIAGIIAAFNGLSSAQLAAIYPQSGGTYEYGYQLLNPTFGFAAGWMFLISKLAAAGVVAISFGSYFYSLVPFTSPVIYAIAAIVLLTLANILGIKKAGLLNIVIVSCTLFALLYLIFSGMPEIKSSNFKPFAPFGLSGIAEASAILFFAFTGYARITTLAEEVKSPEKTIPKAIIITIATAIILYTIVAIVAIGVIGTAEMAESTAPLQRVAAVLSTPLIGPVLNAGAATAMLGVLLSQILGISRMMLAMARRNDLPPALQNIYPRFSVPHVAILLTGLIILSITIFGTFTFIVGAASFTILLYYSITNLAALKQPKTQRLYSPAIPALGLTGCLAMVAYMPFEIVYSSLSILLLGFLLRGLLHMYVAKLKK